MVLFQTISIRKQAWLDGFRKRHPEISLRKLEDFRGLLGSITLKLTISLKHLMENALYCQRTYTMPMKVDIRWCRNLTRY